MEVFRCWNQGQSGTQSNKLGPRPKQWNLPKIHDWLDQNQITDPTDIEFLKRGMQRASWRPTQTARREAVTKNTTCSGGSKEEQGNGGNNHR